MDLQRAALKLDFDTLDMPEGQFLAAGRTWQMCRRGEADPGAFGLHDEAGYFFIAMNLMRDLAALNKEEMQPWDDWGAMPPSDEAITPDDFALFDRLADLTTPATRILPSCAEPIRRPRVCACPIASSTRGVNRASPSSLGRAALDHGIAARQPCRMHLDSQPDA